MTSFSLSAIEARLTLPRWLPFLLVVVLAILLRCVSGTNADVSWGLTMAEKWLDGQRLYIDVLEVNPPATVFLYALPMALERAIGLRAEIAVDVLVFLAAGLSLWLSGRILSNSTVVERGQEWPLLAVVAAAILILPAQTFGEREQIALIVFLPSLAVAAVRSKGERPSWPMVAVAGVCGGIVAIIKPHFAAAIVFTVVVAALSARSWRVLFAFENWIATVLLAAYGALVLVAYPHFVNDVMPLLLLAYVPMKEDFFSFILHIATPVWVAMLLLIARLKRRSMFDAPFSLLLAASAGFSVAYFAQQKGWPYQSYPMLALALIALVLAVLDRRRQEVGHVTPNRSEWLAGGFITASMAAVTFAWMNVAEDRSAVTAAVRKIMPNPKILEISVDLSIGHPLTRDVGGTWVSRVSAQWLTLGAEVLLDRGGLDAATRDALKAAAVLDRKMLTEDIISQQPDLILVHRARAFDWMAWARSDPVLAEQLKAYRTYQTVGDVTILRRAGGG